MSPPPPAQTDSSSIHSQFATPIAHPIVSVPRSDRWRIYQRLQELTIPCYCPDDGSLRVEIHTGINALLLRSVVQQFIAPRQDIVEWLERCWHSEF